MKDEKSSGGAGGPRPDEDAVPLFGNWRNAYLTVVLAFVLEVAFFYAFEKYFS